MLSVVPDVSRVRAEKEVTGSQWSGLSNLLRLPSPGVRGWGVDVEKFGP